MTSRPQRRQRERALRKQATEVCREGLPVPHNPEATLALALAIRDQFRDKSVALRASKAAALVTRVFDLTIRKLPQAYRDRALACVVGCNYCCHNVVMAPAPEIFLIASELRARHAPTFVAEVSAKCDTVSGLGYAARAGKKVPCPLLQDGRCSIYSRRPSVCRKHTSFTLSACLSEYEGKKCDIPIRKFEQEIFECCGAAFMAGMRLWDDRQSTVYELSGALRVALGDPQAEQKWLGGEGVFDGVSAQANIPGIDEHVAFLLRRLSTDQA